MIKREHRRAVVDFEINRYKTFTTVVRIGFGFIYFYYKKAALLAT